MTLGIRICFSSVLRVDRFLLLDVGSGIYLLRNAQSSHNVNLHRFYGSLLLVVVLSDYYSQFLSVSICPIPSTMYMIVSMRLAIRWFAS